MGWTFRQTHLAVSSLPFSIPLYARFRLIGFPPRKIFPPVFFLPFCSFSETCGDLSARSWLIIRPFSPHDSSRRSSPTGFWFPPTFDPVPLFCVQIERTTAYSLPRSGSRPFPRSVDVLIFFDSFFSELRASAPFSWIFLAGIFSRNWLAAGRSKRATATSVRSRWRASSGLSCGLIFPFLLPSFFVPRPIKDLSPLHLWPFH